MTRKAALYRLKQPLALTLALSLAVSPGLPVAVFAGDNFSAPPASSQGWQALVGGYPSPAAIPFLRPFQITTQEQMAGFLRVIGRTPLTPEALAAKGLTPQQQVQILRASIDGYAGELARRARALADPSDQSLRALHEELQDLPTVLSFAPERARVLEEGREAVTALIERRQTALGEPISRARELWNDKKDPGASVQGAADSKQLPAAWRLQKHQPRAEISDQAAAPSPNPALDPENQNVLETLGLSYGQFQRLAAAQIEFEREMIQENPSLSQSIFSLRTQQRFSQTVLSLTKELRLKRLPHPLASALLIAVDNYYADQGPLKKTGWQYGASEDALEILIRKHFKEFIPDGAWRAAGNVLIEEPLLGIRVGRDPLSLRVARLLLASDPVLFKEGAGADARLMRTLENQSRALGAELAVLYSHPFTEDRQLIGHKVPKKGEDRLVFGLGELLRQIRRADLELERARKEGRRAKRFLFLVKNIEAMDPAVRTVLQEALRIRELSHPELGAVKIPANLQFLFTIREGTNLEDDSFYDRVVSKSVPADESFKAPEALAWPKNATEDDYLSQISVRREKDRAVLVLPGAEIALAEDFKEITSDNFQDVIYLKTGLILDYETVRMLAAMAQANAKGLPLLRIEGPTGVGKTFTAQGYARLRGRNFFSNPVNADTELTEWIGGFEQDARGLFRFNGETPFKQRLEEGGVVAVSELNTLLDGHEKASLAWWLAQIAKTRPDPDGFRIIRLTEVPTAPGEAVPAIRVHPRTLIVVDTNPEGDYAARGALPEVFKENVPVLRVEPLASGDGRRFQLERERLQRYADLFLKHDWIKDGDILAPGIKENERRDEIASSLATAYLTVLQAQAGKAGIDGRVLSTRELKRMTQDVLFDLRSGMDWRSAIGNAAYRHLLAPMSSIEGIEGRKNVAGNIRYRTRAFLKDELIANDFQLFVEDQLFMKKRPVHARVSPETDVRPELAKLLEQDPGIALSIISAIEETDRFQMEGGLVPDEKREELTFGPGMFGRLIEKAKAHPDRRVLYVFDNAHNLRPEQIVALNEFLQDGKLYPKGHSGGLSLPPNAHVLFISRTDSPLLWSPAERSRLVEFQYGPGAPKLDPAALSPLPPDIASWISAWFENLYRDLSRGADGGSLSHRKLARFAGDVAEIIEQGAGLGLGALTGKLRQAAQDILLAALPPGKRESAAQKHLAALSALGHYDRLHPEGESPQRQAVKNLLAKAKRDLIDATDDGSAREAAAAIKNALPALGSSLVWKTMSNQRTMPSGPGNAGPGHSERDPVAALLSVLDEPPATDLNAWGRKIKDLSIVKPLVLRQALAAPPHRKMTLTIDAHPPLESALRRHVDAHADHYGVRSSELKLQDIQRINDPERLVDYILAIFRKPDGTPLSLRAKASGGRLTLADPLPSGVPVDLGPDPDQPAYRPAPSARHAVTPDGKFMALIAERTIKLLRWDEASKSYHEAARRAWDHKGRPAALAISPDGHSLALLGEEGELSVWAHDERTPQRPFDEIWGTKLAHRATSVKIADGASKLLIGDVEGSVRGMARRDQGYEVAWEAEKIVAWQKRVISPKSGVALGNVSDILNQTPPLAVPVPILSVDWTENHGTVMAVGADNNVRVYTPASGRMPVKTSYYVDLREASISSDGLTLMIQQRRRASVHKPINGDWKQGATEVWSESWGGAGAVSALSRDGRTIAAISHAFFRHPTPPTRVFQIRISRWDGSQYKRFIEKEMDVTDDTPLPESVALTSNEERIAVGFGKNSEAATVWGIEPALLKDHGKNLISLKTGKVLDQRNALRIGDSVSVAQELPLPWEQLVNQARLKLAFAADDGERKKALRELDDLLKSQPDQWTWEEKPRSEIKELDIVHDRPPAAPSYFLHDELSGPYARVIPGTSMSGPIIGQGFLRGSGPTLMSTWISRFARFLLSFLAPLKNLLNKTWSAVFKETLQGRKPDISAAGGMMATSANPPNAYYTPGKFKYPISEILAIFKDEKTALRLSDGYPFEKNTFSEKVHVLALPERKTAPPAAAAFAPRYGDKPFYYAADDRGAVYLNFNGAWLPTQHRILSGAKPAAPEETASVLGEPKNLRPLALDAVRHPYAQKETGLTHDDFLHETPVLAEVEDNLFKAFAAGWAVNLIGRPGAGKTSTAMEAALLLGLPRFKFQMHGERELSDLIGSYREDQYGHVRLTAGPTRDQAGRRRFKLPLLDFLVNGGVFVLDEGAVGQRGRELLSWFAAIAGGDKEIVLQEFPGREIRLPVHPDFHLVITNNDPGETAGRQPLKSEIAANAHLIYVDEDESPETLKNLFVKFLGDAPASARDKERWAETVARAHHALKPLLGKEIGKDNKDRYYLSKREVRRVAGQVRRHLLEHQGTGGDYALYRALRTVYEAMFSHPDERRLVYDALFSAKEKESERVIPKNEIPHDALLKMAAKIHGIALVDDSPWRERMKGRYDRTKGKVKAKLNSYRAEFSKTLSRMRQDFAREETDDERFKKEADALFPAAATAHEAWVESLTRALFLQGEPVLHIVERGARSDAMVSATARSLSAAVEAVDAAPEHGELELLGGLLPWLGPRPQGSPRSRQVRGRITRHLLASDEMTALARGRSPPRPVILWMRNVDQWKEEIRTALNGLLEDGYIDLEVEDGRVERLYKPAHLHFLAEMPSDSTQEFSSAFFNRWVKIGVSRDAVQPPPTEKTSDFERVLRRDYALGPLETHYVSALFKALSALDQEKGWANRRRYEFGPTLFYALARALKLARQDGPASTQTLFAREARRLVASRLSRDAAHTGIPDAERFEKILKIILGAEAPREDPGYKTQNGSLDSRLVEVDGVPVAAAKEAPTALAAARKNGIRLSPQMITGLGILAQAARLGKATALVGETGAGKTSLAALWADLIGSRFYKYQAHGGSEIADLTVDIEQAESGEFKKRVKEFYRLLKEGRVVIDVDEANVAPWVLWTLEPLLRGESLVYPIFPEEPPFTVGDGVQVVLTYNPERYAGRNAIDPRLLEPMIVAEMALPDLDESARIIASFYGVWEQPKTASVASKPAPASVVLGAASRAAATLKNAGPLRRAGSDRRMRKGQETFDPTDQGSAKTGGGAAKTQAQGIFTPELYPYTRRASYDRYDARSEEWIGSEDLEALEVPTPPTEPALERLRRTHDLFEGRVRMDLGRSWSVLPSAGAEMRFLEVKAVDLSGRELRIPVELAKDSADNYYIRARHPQKAEIRYRVAAPAHYYGHTVPKGIAFDYPDQIPDEVREAMAAAGLTGGEDDLRAVLYRLIGFFRDFSLQENGIKKTGASLYLDLIRARCGVCRHRAFAFARTALGLGIAVRYVLSENHAWAEVHIPHLGWLRIDLGGGGDPANMDLSPLSQDRHQARQGDDFPQPETYRRNGEEFAKRMEQAMKDQGLKSRSAGRAGGGGGVKNLAKDGERIQKELDGLKQSLTADARIHDELAELYSSGRGGTEFVFQRMLRALQNRVRIMKKKVKRGLEIDPVAFMLKKPKQFVRRKQEEKLQSTALAVLFDFSGSMDVVKRQLAYTIGTVGENFWKLRETAPQHFYYDLSWFTHEPQARTVVGMGERMGQDENAKRLVAMANQVGTGGTAILPAVREKLKDFLGSRETRGAKVKYLILFTDGADDGTVQRGGDGYRLTAAMAEVMEQYRHAGVDVIAIGIGAGAEEVKAFNGPGQHHVRIAQDRTEQIAETIAKIAELKSRGAGRLPDGELNALLQIEPPGGNNPGFLEY